MALSVNYLGKSLENPYVLASGPPTANAEMIAKAFAVGWAGAAVSVDDCTGCSLCAQPMPYPWWRCDGISYSYS